jgi:hypothetical protein
VSPSIEPAVFACMARKSGRAVPQMPAPVPPGATFGVPGEVVDAVLELPRVALGLRLLICPRVLHSVLSRHTSAPRLCAFAAVRRTHRRCVKKRTPARPLMARAVTRARSLAR